MSFFLKNKKQQHSMPFITDIHSHLLPDLDDGIKTLEESEKIINQFVQLGYSKLITTPHIMSNRYYNSSDKIKKSLKLLKQHIKKINISIEAAAEYYLDESLLKKINTNEKIMTFGDNYFLFETDFFSEPYFLEDFVFGAINKGYKPVLAHPERYHYIISNINKVEKLRNQGLLFQINIPSIVGFYSKKVQQTVIYLITKGWVDFMGSDCHGQCHMKALTKAFKSKHFKNALKHPLLNYSL